MGGPGNIQIETIVAPAVADAILEELSGVFFDDFVIIAWVVEVGVLRGSKFTGVESEENFKNGSGKDS